MKKTLGFGLGLKGILPFLFAWNACATQSRLNETPYPEVRVDPSLTVNTEQLRKVQIFAFGSCNKQYLPQPLWKNIVSEKPDLFLWTGDVVYADTEDMGKLSQIYASQLQTAEYQTFLAAKIPVLGIWDDHDYGVNAGDARFPQKKKSQELFLDFIGESASSPRRKQEGIQAAYSFEGVRFLLLDTHAHRTSSDILGDAQWQWLEGELKKNRGGVTFLVSSIQVLGTEQKFEKWFNFPASYQRLRRAIADSPAQTIIIISGDRHFAELTQDKIGNTNVFEVTSSGMTHSFRNPDDARNHNSRRVGPILDRLNYGVIQITDKTVRVQVKDLNNTAVIDQVIPIEE